MDILAVQFPMLVAITVMPWILPVSGRGHVPVSTPLAPRQVAATCDATFSRPQWRGIDGRRDLSCRARGAAQVVLFSPCVSESLAMMVPIDEVDY
jgi:hypothetical protein